MGKTKIICDVSNCKFQKQQECCADTISVCCDDCVQALSPHETACKSFTCESKK